MSIFTWTRTKDHRGDTLWLLHNPDMAPSPLVGDTRLGVASHLGKRVWRATFWTGYNSINHDAGSMARAVRLLEADLSLRFPGATFEGSPQ